MAEQHQSFKTANGQSVPLTDLLDMRTNIMYEWEVQYSKTKSDDERISCAVWTATVCADTEDEVRKIMMVVEPGKSIGKITRGEYIDDNA